MLFLYNITFKEIALWFCAEVHELMDNMLIKWTLSSSILKMEQDQVQCVRKFF